MVQSASDLSAKNGYLVALSNSSGTPVCDVAAAQGDYVVYLVVDGKDALGDKVQLRPLDPNRNHRAVLKSTCVTGDILVQAAISTPADAGKLRKLPATAGRYLQIGIAEESGADGQLVKFRPCIKYVNVVNADTLTALTFTGGGATGPQVEALRDALKTILEAQVLMA